MGAAEYVCCGAEMIGGAATWRGAKRAKEEETAEGGGRGGRDEPEPVPGGGGYDILCVNVCVCMYVFVCAGCVVAEVEGE